MAQIKHYWDAPRVPASAPSATSVVIRSRCGQRMTIPVWRVTEWERNSPAAAAIPPAEVCVMCADATPPACHAFKPITNGGVNLCTLLTGHRGDHLDTVKNVGWADR